MNIDKMRRYLHGGDEEAIARSESLARFRGTVGRRTMTKAQQRRHDATWRRLMGDDEPDDAPGLREMVRQVRYADGEWSREVEG